MLRSWRPTVGQVALKRSIDRADRPVMGEPVIDRPPVYRWLTIMRSAGLGLALAGVISIGWHHTHEPEPQPRSCPADARVLDDGTVLHRDLDHGCAWVDGHGHVITTAGN